MQCDDALEGAEEIEPQRDAFSGNCTFEVIGNVHDNPELLVVVSKMENTKEATK